MLFMNISWQFDLPIKWLVLKKCFLKLITVAYIFFFDFISFSCGPLTSSTSILLVTFSTGSAYVAVAFAFSAQVFFRVVFKGASSCFLSGYLSGPDKEVRLPAVSAFNQRAAFSMASLTYTVKRLSQHWRSRLCVKRQTVRGGDRKINGFMFFSCFVILGGQWYSLNAQRRFIQVTRAILFRIKKKKTVAVVALQVKSNEPT